MKAFDAQYSTSPRIVTKKPFLLTTDVVLGRCLYTQKRLAGLVNELHCQLCDLSDVSTSPAVTSFPGQLN